MSVIKILKNKLNRIKNTFVSIVLCIRFPFLYPRNRFTGLHYNNWKIIEKLKFLYNSAYLIGNKDSGFKPIVINRWKWIQYKLLRFFHNYFLQVIFCIPTYNELDSLDYGWRKAFGIQICKEIKRALLNEVGVKGLYSYRIADIKEKNGSLVWSDFGATREVSKIIAKYEYISARTCIECGKTADGMSTGYILPYCKNCANGTELDMYYTKEMPFYDHYYTQKKKDTEMK